jgi:alkanesulfonate monooxygenase SsuD/methylene tetrahydromethanopterin reductase-like flavin-dependent oxidoreductase (luciferase family)
VRVGIVLNGRRSADDIAELARLAEAAGIRNIWLSGGSRSKDHALRLAVAATRTSSITLGPVAISPFEAHPARIAIELLTLQEISGGRAAVVLGGGGDLAATLGVAFAHRVRAVDETLDIVRAVARGGEVNHRGRVFAVHGLFSPWSGMTPPTLYVGANRPRMLAMAARKADGVMFSDMPSARVAALVQQLRAGAAAGGRAVDALRVNNWFVWNLQSSRSEAVALATRLLAFRLYYIRDVASVLGLAEPDVTELERRQGEMLRAIFEGRAAPWQPRPELVEVLIRHLTLSGGPQDVDACIERLLEFERGGLTEIALALHGEPARAIKLLGERVVQAVQKPEER